MSITGQKAASELMKTGIRTATTIAGAYGKRSISRVAKDAIFQFPTFISHNIPDDDGTVIARGLEREYAAFVVAAFGLNKAIDRTKYNSTAEFLKAFHQNSDIPAAIFNNGNVVLDSAHIVPEGSTYVDPIMLYSLWDNANESQFDEEVINNMYRPFNRTTRKLQARMNMATEAKDSSRSQKAPQSQTQKPSPAELTKQYNEGMTGEFNASPIKKEVQATYHKLYGPNGSPNESNVRKNQAEGYAKSANKTVIGMGSNKPNEIVAGEKYLSLEPTLVKLDLVNYTDATTWTDSIMIGVKAMVRLVPPGQMTANMIEAVQNRAIFKAIKYNRGEIGLIDMILGTKDAKKAGINAAKGKWLDALKRRRMIDKASILTGHRLMPTAAIIMTEQEVLEVKEQTGIDLHNPSNARKVMDKYFLLGFGIYNTDDRILTVMFDGDDGYRDTSLRALVSLITKDTDVLNMRR